MPDAQTTFDRDAAVFRAGRDRVHALADGLSEAQVNWKPTHREWSVAECVAHLNILGAAYVPAMQAAVEAAPLRPAVPRRLRVGLLGGLFVRAVRPGARPVKTVASMRPPAAGALASRLDAAALLRAFDRDTDVYLALCAAAGDVDAGRVRVASPFLRALRLPLAAFLEGLGQHVLRHAGQMERVVLHAGFPKRDAE